MSPYKLLFRVFQVVFLFVFLMNYDTNAKEQAPVESDKIPIGIITLGVLLPPGLLCRFYFHEYRKPRGGKQKPVCHYKIIHYEAHGDFQGYRIIKYTIWVD